MLPYVPTETDILLLSDDLRELVDVSEERVTVLRSIGLEPGEPIAHIGETALATRADLFCGHATGAGDRFGDAPSLDAKR